LQYRALQGARRVESCPVLSRHQQWWITGSGVDGPSRRHGDRQQPP